jgi:hypothetical protein
MGPLRPARPEQWRPRTRGSGSRRCPGGAGSGGGARHGTVTLVRDGLVAQGHVTREEIEPHRSGPAVGRPDVAVPPLVSAWGRRP